MREGHECFTSLRLPSSPSVKVTMVNERRDMDGVLRPRWTR